MLSGVPSFSYERYYWQQGIQYVAGLDEVGVGALAGPAVAAAVMFLSGTRVQGIRDSKQLQPRRRQELVAYIKTKAIGWAIAEASVDEIALFNIHGAVRLAMRRAVEQIVPAPQFLLIDGLPTEHIHPAVNSASIVKGDCLSFTIAAASILAKEYRDALMKKLDTEFPVYGFAEHKGYATARHKQALTRFGATAHHRAAYAPVASVLTKSV